MSQGASSKYIILYDDNGRPLAVSDGVAIPADTSSLLVTGKDGSGNARVLLTDTSSRLVMAGAGTAGSPAGGVVSIQGVTSGQAVPVSQSTAASLSGYWPVRVTDGTNTAPTMDSAARSGFVRLTNGTSALLGQQPEADSLPVVLASDQSPLPSEMQVGLMSGFVPDPASYMTGDLGTLIGDAENQLRTRGTILTDEGSLRSDFGEALRTTIAGTVTFTNGSTTVTGSGTAFTSELSTQKYIRRTSHTDDDFVLVASIESDTQLTLDSGYTGASGSGSAYASKWIPVVGSGGSLSESSSILNIANPTTSGIITGIHRFGDYPPYALNFYASISQRVANQQAIVGFQDVAFSPGAQAVFVFDGTDATKVRCRSSNDSNSVQESYVTLPAAISTSSTYEYEIDLTVDGVIFLVNGSRVAKHRQHVPDMYASLEIVAYIENTDTVSGSTTLYLDSIFFENTDTVQINNIFSGAPMPIEGVQGGVPVSIQFGNPGGATALPNMINAVYSASDGAIVANTFKRVLSYTVPGGYSGYLIKFTSYQSEPSSSRAVVQSILGSHSVVSNTFTSGTPFTAPQFGAITQAEVTTAFTAGSGNVTITVTYTNNLGASGRTGTITIPKGSTVGSRWDLVLQSGDIGCRSIQSVSASPTLAAGVINILGLIQLAVHQDQSTTTQTETLYAPGAITFPTGTVIGIEYSGGTVSKQRTFDTLIQLVPT